MNNKTIKRADIVLINIPKDINDPHKQTGVRPCVITSNDDNNLYCERVHYIPLTTKIKRTYIPTHVVLKTTETPEPSMALCEDLDSIDKSLVIKKIGVVSNEDMFNIEMALLRQQGIIPVLFFNKMTLYNAVSHG